MKKVLLLFDGANFSPHAISFAQQLHRLSPVLVTAVFAPLVSLANMWGYALAGETGAPVRSFLEEDEDRQVHAHIRQFEHLCQEKGLPYRVHKVTNDLALPALRRESRFADLLILSSETFYNGMLFSDPFRFLREALHDAECPVLIFPETSSFPAQNLVAYDGGRESVYALKQFAYTLPGLAQQPTTVAHASKGTGGKMPEALLVEELANVHFKNVTFRQLDLGDQQDFREWIEGQPDTLLVAGAFARSGLSEFFHASFCAGVVRNHRLPVFIAHH
ncbi:universal stress protein [Flaviaesturariibacter flavus]|uniref:Universal stress protein n=1 Tax=Flaviaesturariibacter flavus TaxID=2502780 RepID=A0A4R1BND5_9BACT|nr:universal stress protein [Flaviaesturariibacter flavus]TCJ19083.1 universal stress protein [Flaviaesturariibacter flavus]